VCDDGREVKSTLVQQKEFTVLQVIAFLLFLVDGESVKVLPKSCVSAAVFLHPIPDFRGYAVQHVKGLEKRLELRAYLDT
jgi:hypothetical protein